MDDDKQLYNLCLKGDIHKVRMVLARGVDTNKKVGTDGWTALHAGAWKGHQEVVELLLKQPGISVNAAESKGRTALHYAANEGHQEVVALLLQQPEIVVNPTDNDGVWGHDKGHR